MTDCAATDDACDPDALTCVDPCLDVVCDAPPADGCEGHVLSVYPAQGVCVATAGESACEYTATVTDCAATDDACDPDALTCVDPCLDVVCDAPPPDGCEGHVLSVYPAQGVCVATAGESACEYTATVTDCAATDDACDPDALACVDPCLDVVCDAPPADGCEGDVLKVYEATGACVATAGESACEYAVTDTDCAAEGEVCNAALLACVTPDLACQGVVCDAPPAPTCDGDSVLTWAAEGTCAEGTCDYGDPVATDCTAGGAVAATCTSGACVMQGDVVFNELMLDPTAVAGQWFELLNLTAGDLELAGCVVSDLEGEHVIAGSLVVPAGGAVVLAASSDPLDNGGFEPDYVYGLDLALDPVASYLELSCGGLSLDAVLVDEAFGAEPGVALQLDPELADAELNDDPAAWCAASAVYGDGDLGSPGAANPACVDPCAGVVCDAPPADGCDGDAVVLYEDGVCVEGVCDYAPVTVDCEAGETCQDGQCVVIGGAAGQPPVGVVVFSEIMFDPKATTDPNGEYFELYNTGAVAYDLNGCKLADNGASFTLTQSLVIAPGGYLVFTYGTAATNGGIDTDFDYGAISGNKPALGNSGDSLKLTCDAGQVDAVTFTTSGAWPAKVAGVSYQLSADLLDADLNDDGAAWCASTAAYASGDFGTPGAANAVCP